MTSTPNPLQWVQNYADYLYSFALARLDNEELARDLVQETFLSALESLDQFKGHSSERTWLTAIVKYKVIEVYRKRNSGLKTIGEEQEPGMEFFEPDNGHWKEDFEPQPLGLEYSDPIATKELITVLKICMQKLPALWRSIFSMKHMDEMSTKVICKELKVTPSNFWVIMHRAKVNLRACIQKEWL